MDGRGRSDYIFRHTREAPEVGEGEGSRCLRSLAGLLAQGFRGPAGGARLVATCTEGSVAKEQTLRKPGIIRKQTGRSAHGRFPTQQTGASKAEAARRASWQRGYCEGWGEGSALICFSAFLSTNARRSAQGSLEQGSLTSCGRTSYGVCCGSPVGPLEIRVAVRNAGDGAECSYPNNASVCKSCITTGLARCPRSGCGGEVPAPLSLPIDVSLGGGPRHSNILETKGKHFRRPPAGP